MIARGGSLEAEELCREKLSAGKMGQAAQAPCEPGQPGKTWNPSHQVKYECEHMGNGSIHIVIVEPGKYAETM